MKLESMRKLKGIFRVDSSRIYPRFPTELLSIFCGFVGDKTGGCFYIESLEILKRKLQKNQGEFKGYCNKSHFL